MRSLKTVAFYLCVDITFSYVIYSCVFVFVGTSQAISTDDRAMIPHVTWDSMIFCSASQEVQEQREHTRAIVAVSAFIIVCTSAPHGIFGHCRS